MHHDVLPQSFHREKLLACTQVHQIHFGLSALPKNRNSFELIKQNPVSYGLPLVNKQGFPCVLRVGVASVQVNEETNIVDFLN
jgi:hypothetical protein